MSVRVIGHGGSQDMASEHTIILSQSPVFRRVLRAAQMVAATDATVLLLGESGTGKELLARAIHQDSSRASGPFVAMNCAALTEGRIESELAGYLRGTFSGSEQGEEGTGGTLFLDEVTELSLSSQAKLLGFLADPEYPSLGQRGCDSVGLRLIAATHRDLRQAVEAGRFRADLYYRLCVVPLELPPLRERVEDIGPLLDHFLATGEAEQGLVAPRFSAGARRALNAYPWPGNVRELRNLCVRMLILFPGVTLGVENLPLEIRRGYEPAPTWRFALPPSGINLQDLEVDVIRQALALAGGNKSRAARLLGLTRDTLLYRLQKYLIEA